MHCQHCRHRLAGAHRLQGRTSIFVAHRLSTIAGCDRILVLSEGRLVEQGSHAELLASNGVYADMWRAQAQAAAEAASVGGLAGILSSTNEEESSVPPLVEPLPALSERALAS